MKIEVRLHYECIGIMPPSHDPSTPRGSMPDDVTLVGINESVLAFVNQTSNRKLLEDRLSHVHGQVDWSARASGTLVISCSAPMSEMTPKLKESWPDTVSREAKAFLASFVHNTIEVLQDCCRKL